MTYNYLTGKQRSDAVRTEPILLDAEGRAFWKLRCLGAEEDTLLQGQCFYLVNIITLKDPI